MIKYKKTLLIISLLALFLSSCGNKPDNVKEETTPPGPIVLGSYGQSSFIIIPESEKVGNRYTKYGYGEIHDNTVNRDVACFSMPAGGGGTNFYLELTYDANFNVYESVSENSSLLITHGTGPTSTPIRVPASEGQIKKTMLTASGHLYQGKYRFSITHGYSRAVRANDTETNRGYIYAYPNETIKLFFAGATSEEVAAIKSFAQKVFKQAVCAISVVASQGQADCVIGIDEGTLMKVELDIPNKIAILDRLMNQDDLARTCSFAIGRILGLPANDDDTDNIMNLGGDNNAIHLRPEQWDAIHRTL